MPIKPNAFVRTSFDLTSSPPLRTGIPYRTRLVQTCHGAQGKYDEEGQGAAF